ncbi:lipoyl amidotransferase LIPT1, mitochondrial-like isoform X2 [Halichondria panicea]|uniref:lipoyl amidotransferase LIPT1, mitochondrial-like isoform X2 n=1 Tax=Halichondria panicea TaxID=6063 RepID=UPI00312B5A77
MAWAGATREIVVYKSLSNDVFTNLAFEDWVFKNLNLSHARILFFWRNTSCVVIGRHQNPWKEANLHLLRNRGMTLVRRKSGGGAVYHDLGNTNCTIFSSRQDYNRKRNLQLICDAVNQKWKVNLQRNKKDDIICKDKWKVSGSSAKLLKDLACHHFTLLLNVNLQNLRQLLTSSSEACIRESRATASTPSDVINLCNIEPSMNYNDVCSVIAEKFYDVHQVDLNRWVIDIDPLTLPGVMDIKKELQEWNWIYGKTPKFTVQNTKRFSFGDAHLSMEIQQGIIKNVKLDISWRSDDLPAICKAMEGKRVHTILAH